MLETASAMTSQPGELQCNDDDDDSHMTEIASLMLRRTNAVPIRLKILLDRLFTGLRHERVQHILQQCGWLYEDYLRGYKLQVL